MWISEEVTECYFYSFIENSYFPYTNKITDVLIKEDKIFI